MMALLSSFFDKWQSEQVLVSCVRTVCGKCGANACAEKPTALIGGCWV
jgi:positive regulator of sigma E activity